MNAKEAVSGFLRKIRELETYGTQLYDTRYEDSTCQLGLSPGGVSIFRRNRRILFQDWSNVSEVSFKNKKLLVVIVGIAVSAVLPCRLLVCLGSLPLSLSPLSLPPSVNGQS